MRAPIGWPGGGTSGDARGRGEAARQEPKESKGKEWRCTMERGCSVQEREEMGKGSGRGRRERAVGRAGFFLDHRAPLSTHSSSLGAPAWELQGASEEKVYSPLLSTLTRRSRRAQDVSALCTFGGVRFQPSGRRPSLPGVQDVRVRFPRSGPDRVGALIHRLGGGWRALGPLSSTHGAR